MTRSCRAGPCTLINAKKIKMASNTDCIMGQLAKKAGEGKEAALEYAYSLGLEPTCIGLKKLLEDDMVKYGFMRRSIRDTADAWNTPDLWRAEVASRIGDPAVVEKKSPKKKSAKA